MARCLQKVSPKNWQQVKLHCRSVGKHHEVSGRITLEDGTSELMFAPLAAYSIFDELRREKHEPTGLGTWFTAEFWLERNRFQAQYDHDFEPAWETVPPPKVFADELERFPRDEENIPPWLADRIAGRTPAPPPAFREAKVFDGRDAAGRPVVNRPQLPAHEIQALAAYLEHAPMVLRASGAGQDEFAPGAHPDVPLTFHTDGNWIWPGSVPHYLRKYALPPEPDLITHIRSLEYNLDQPSESVQRAAVSVIVGRRPATPTAPKPTPPNPEPLYPAATAPHPAGQQAADAPTPPAVPPQPVAEDSPVPPADDHAGYGTPAYRATTHSAATHSAATDGATTDGSATDSATTDSATTNSATTNSATTESDTTDSVAADGDLAAPGIADTLSPVAGSTSTRPADPAEQTTQEPTSETPVATTTAPALTEDDSEEIIVTLRQRLDDLGVHPDAYGICAPAAAGGPVLDRREGGAGWQVTTAQGTVPFDSLRDAAQYLLGAAVLAPANASSAETTDASRPPEWPFGPLPGEPPLSLFRDRKLVVLPAGTEVDRFGDPTGNLTYAARTMYTNRSLPPDYLARPYRAYRVERLLQAIKGTAVPWFGQAGGGTGYLLPRSVAELVADGTLVEINETTIEPAPPQVPGAGT
jgi:hypothetical protein